MATQATTGAAGSAAVGGALMLIGLDMIRVLEELVTAGIEAGDFRADLDPERAVVLVGQQIYGALSVRAGEPDPIPADAGGRRDLRVRPFGTGTGTRDRGRT